VLESDIFGEFDGGGSYQGIQMNGRCLMKQNRF
jgi:hypothetical protein